MALTIIGNTSINNHTDYFAVLEFLYTDANGNRITVLDDNIIAPQQIAIVDPSVIGVPSESLISVAVLMKKNPSHSASETIQNTTLLMFEKNAPAIANYNIAGQKNNFTLTLAPNGFPAQVPVSVIAFENWSLAIRSPAVWACIPNTPDDLVAVCNWAKSAGFRIRASGIKHTWSPLTITEGTTTANNIMLVDTSKFSNITVNQSQTRPSVTTGTGTTLEELLSYLAEPPTGGSFCFTHTPAPGHLTVGGMLAINAHGTAVPNELEPSNQAYGSLSNQILSFTAIISDAETGNYKLQQFNREDLGSEHLLVHLGRLMVVEVTLAIYPNFNLRCQSFMDLPASRLFKMPNPENPYEVGTFGGFVHSAGRAEAIWFPFTEMPWLKVWSRCDEQPKSARLVTAPYNYPFSDHLPEFVTPLIKDMLTGIPSLTRFFGKTMYDISLLGLSNENAFDLWGQAKNTLLYVRDTTLRVTANGYAIQMQRSDIQRGVAEFTAKFSDMLESYAAQGKYPINGPLEIRVTGLDVPLNMGITAASPSISSLSHDATAIANQWDVALWLDVLTIPGTPYADDFYRELEQWMFSNFCGTYARCLPEWSKGWAYTNACGAWTDASVLAKIRSNFSQNRPTNNDWAAVNASLNSLDSSQLFYNDFLVTLFDGQPT